MTALRIVVEGRVQGVGYRAWAVAEARRLGLKGWVRNRRDGSVEVLAAGDSPALDQFVRLLADGPRAAAVTGLRSEPADASGQTSFVQGPTV